MALGQAAEAQAALQTCLGLSINRHDGQVLERALLLAASLLLVQEQGLACAQCLGLASVLAAGLGQHSPQLYGLSAEPLLEALRARLDEQALAQAWSTGAAGRLAAVALDLLGAPAALRAYFAGVATIDMGR
jgi:hypothetical protein